MTHQGALAAHTCCVKAKPNNTGFTSGTQARDGRKANRDRFPYVCAGARYSTPEGGVALAESGENAGHWVESGGPGFRYDPRPEYDVEDNPILASFREDVVKRDAGFDRAKLVRSWLTWLTNPPELSDVRNGYTDIQITQAIRVLSKLANAKARHNIALESQDGVR